MSHIAKDFITPQQFFEDSAKLGKKIVDSGFRPTFILGIWRGGAVPALVIDEVLRYHGYRADTISPRTSRYVGIGEAGSKVRVHAIDYLRSTLKPNDSILIVDDVFDSGTSLKAIIDAISNLRYSDLRIATVYYKPQCNKQTFIPNFFVHVSDKWLVFPHEFEGLTPKEVEDHKKWF